MRRRVQWHLSTHVSAANIACRGGPRADSPHRATQPASCGVSELSGIGMERAGRRRWLRVPAGLRVCTLVAGLVACHLSLHILQIHGLGLEMQRAWDGTTSEIHGLGLDFSVRQPNPCTHRDGDNGLPPAAQRAQGGRLYQLARGA